MGGGGSHRQVGGLNLEATGKWVGLFGNHGQMDGLVLEATSFGWALWEPPAVGGLTPVRAEQGHSGARVGWIQASAMFQ